MTDWTRRNGTVSTAFGGAASAVLAITTTVSGDANFGGLLVNTGRVVTNLTDDKGNAYYWGQVGDDDAVALKTFLYRSRHLITNAPSQIQVTLDAVSSNFWVLQDAFTPPTGTTDISMDGGAVAVSNAGLVTPSWSTTQPDVLIYSVNFSGTSATTGAGFNVGQGSGTQQCSEWKIQASPGSVNGAYATSVGNGWMMAMGIAPVAATWQVVQHKMQRTVTNATTGSVTFDNAVQTGSVVIGTIAIDDVANITTFTDDKSNSYTLSSPNSNGRAIYRSNGIVNNGPKTLTINLSTSSTTVFLQANEFAAPSGATGIAADGYSNVPLFSPTLSGSQTLPNITTMKANDLAYSFNDTGNGGSVPASGYSQLNGGNIPGGPTTWSDAYQLLPTAGTFNTTWNFNNTSANENAALAAFNAVIGGGALVMAPTVLVNI